LLVSFTGSENVGRVVGKIVQSRFGKVLLELGGNNGACRSLNNQKELTNAHPAAIVMPDADLSLAVPAVFFGSVGTTGQRCTSTRRLYLHRSIAPEFLSRLQNLYASLTPGDPLDARTLLGPLHTRAAVAAYDTTITELKSADAQILVGGARYDSAGNFVRPTIAQPVSPQGMLWETERFAPVLLVAEFEQLEQAIKWNNGVPQGLSSSLWTRDIRNVGKWIGPAGSDAGIVNVRFLFILVVWAISLDIPRRTGQRGH
jgi:aldehyde dehydrogenase family 7 protein A1